MKIENITLYALGIWGVIISYFIDESVAANIYLIKTPFLDYLLGTVTHFGSVVVVLVIMTSLFMWEERKREWIPTLWASFIVSSLLCLALKAVVARERPHEAVELLVLSTAYSFPSLHTAASFAAVPILDLEFPRFKWFWIIFALVVAFSRIYLNVHYLSDVIGGMVLGFAVSHFFVFIEKKYKIFRRISIFR